jgi:hypothetical protein
MDRHDEKAEFHELLPKRVGRAGAGVKVIRGKDATNSVGCKKISIPSAFRRPFTGSLLTAIPIHLPCLFCYMIAPQPREEAPNVESPEAFRQRRIRHSGD